MEYNWKLQRGWGLSRSRSHGHLSGGTHEDTERQKFRIYFILNTKIPRMFLVTSTELYILAHGSSAVYFSHQYDCQFSLPLILTLKSSTLQYRYLVVMSTSTVFE